MKLTVLGGSAVATPELIAVLAGNPDRPALEVVLHGRSPGKLETVGRLCARLAARAGGALRVSHTTDLDGALEGADFVLNQIRVGGYAARAFDETFPHALGLPGEETVGPGGFSLTLRTVPVVLDYCRRIERRAPRAVMINLTNPSSLIQYAITRYSSVRSIGVCDVPVTLGEMAAGALDTARAGLDVDYVGMHHFGWITGVRQAGRDRLPEVLAQAGALGARLGLDPGLIQALGALPNGYFRYYFHPERMLAAQQGKPPRAETLLALEGEMLQAYAAEGGEAAVARRGAHWYAEIVVPVLDALMAGSEAAFYLNVPNRGALGYLPDDAIVEVPVRLGPGGTALAQAVPPAPDLLRALLGLNATYEALAVEAIVERDRARALQALLANPLIRTAAQAEGTLERVWARWG